MKNSSLICDYSSQEFIQTYLHEYIRLGSNNPFYEIIAAAYSLDYPMDKCDYFIKSHSIIFFNTIKLNTQYDWCRFLQSIRENVYYFVYYYFSIDKKIRLHFSSMRYDNALAQYITSLLDMTDESKESIYYPFCNLSILSLFESSCKFDCFDSNEENLIFSKVLQSFSHNANASFSKASSDCQIEINQVATHSYIVAMPPYHPDGDKDSIENVISIITDTWRPNTKALLICYPSYVLQSKYLEQRQLLVSNNYISKVILLPSGILSGTMLSTFLILLDNSKTSNHTIQFVDFSDYSLLKSKMNAFDYLDLEKVCSFFVDIDDVDASNLSPRKIRMELLAKKEFNSLVNPTPLFNLVSMLRYKEKVSSSVKIISTKHLNDKTHSTNCDFTYIEPSPQTIHERNLAKLDCDCILLPSRLTGYLKPIIFRYTTNNDCYINRSLIALKLNTNETSLEYIVSELSKHYVKTQMFYPNTGTEITAFVLRSVCIEILPTREEQLASIINSKDNTIAEITRELIEIKKKEHDDYINTLRARKHDISHTLGDAASWMDVINDVIKESTDGIVNVKAKINGSSHCLEHLIEIIRVKLDSAVNQVDSLVDKKQFGKATEHDIRKLVSEYISIPHNYPFTYNSNGEFPVFDSNLPDFNILVNINKDDLFKVFQEIVRNAVKYGFDNTSRINNNREINTINFFITLSEINGTQYANIIIGNNGNPLPEGMTQERIFTKGECSSSGTGIGGSDIKNTIKHFGGIVSVNEESDASYLFDDCSVFYSIKLPVIYKQ